MPADSQAVTRLQQDRVAAVEQLQTVQEKKLAAEQAVARWTSTEALLADEISDLDEAIAAAIALP